MVKTDFSVSIAILVAGNLVPLAGAILLDWRAVDLVTLYWIENVLIGLFNVPRMLFAAAEGTVPVPASQRFIDNAKATLFFCVHYGLFCLVHALVLVELFGDGDSEDTGRSFQALLSGMMQDRWVAWGVVALAASHVCSFFINYLGLHEYQRVDAGTLMGLSYRRVFVLQVFAIAGGAMLHHVDGGVMMVVLFIGVKTAIDGYLHNREHQRFAEAGPANSIRQ